ncbi:SsgA family sporulation/cell division regulator [Streptomyces sp. LP11]|uniref:SsgA family sporulation/cell division regulator n=1 Tax=Streptomyces pyxinicus TaxID=2970331 RepID=A0ABT2B3E2_9ACTN|nr:SsgA family sporulation/cell division regulator [Streptomyces sp. LP11]MCS0603038.1 SsgA family sporulation/cell division regulator [Streptomyces sp. LP11]
MNPTDRTERPYLDLTVQLVLGAAAAVPVGVRLGYDPADPLAVRLDFHGASEAVPPWFLSRDQLRGGLRTPTGEGNVRVCPPCACHGPGTVRIVLRGREGAAVLYVPAAPLRGWLAGTFAAVPAGTEGTLIHWDEVVTELLRHG